MITGNNIIIALAAIVFLSVVSNRIQVDAEPDQEQTHFTVAEKKAELAKISEEFKEAANGTKNELESDQRSNLDLAKGDVAELGSEARRQFEGVKNNVFGGFNWAFLGLKESWWKSVETLSKEIDETFDRLKKEKAAKPQTLENVLKDEKQDRRRR